ncbi:hypothetical protein [Pyxidicoccus sp. MSG2]|uniref:hypothetical protein n=1 Tax=Pyxidicoccus sp. MSG2 TaxID=2996790 RepID=UPI00226D6BAC|nr:hypothetical protein [Pyxidicoccus sp. MSG2]MCY1023554.1 hypothetical protein [Pyxidicoccus sp. MSG2]
MKTPLCLTAALAVSLLAPAASAATRTYCFELLLKDERIDCPTPSDPGAKRACHQEFHNFTTQPDGDYTHPVGALVEIWDKDDTSDDEYIGTWILVNPTGGCATFEWEGASYFKGETHPDPYVVWKSEVRGTAGGPHVVARDLANNRYGGVTWRPNAVANCQSGAACNQPGYLLVTTDSTTERGGRAMSLDSSQHMLQVYSSILEAEDIDMVWPESGSAAFNQNKYQVSGTRGDQAQSAAHELGHVLQMQQFDEDDLASDCSFNGSGHSLELTEHESCATAEGWAGYVAIASLWDPENPGSAPSRFGSDFVEAEPIAPVCTDNKGLEAQVVKAFWDLDDSDNELAEAPAGQDDQKNSTTLDIALRWAVFPDGTANRQDGESDPDGVNLWDYHINSQSWWANLDETRQTLLGHNCMGTQDTN